MQLKREASSLHTLFLILQLSMTIGLQLNLDRVIDLDNSLR